MIEVCKCSLEDIKNFDSIAKEHWDSFQNNTPTFNKDILCNFNVVQAKTKETTVGYILYILFKSPYYDEIWSQVDMFYLQPKYRKQGIGKRMFKMLEEDVKAQGASKLIASFNLKQPLEGFYNKLGFNKTHAVVAKEL
jgi:GNAT superfamily N-acetyltransferase